MAGLLYPSQQAFHRQHEQREGLKHTQQWIFCVHLPREEMRRVPTLTSVHTETNGHIQNQHHKSAV